MRKYFMLGIIAGLIALMTGCGGGGDSGSSGGIANITGIWTGTITFVSPMDPALGLAFDMVADLVQTGTAVVGSFDFANMGSSVGGGTFESTTRTGDTLTGIMDDGGVFWETPMPFTATVGASTISGQGTVKFCPTCTASDGTFNLALS